MTVTSAIQTVSALTLMTAISTTATKHIAPVKAVFSAKMVTTYLEAIATIAKPNVPNVQDIPHVQTVFWANTDQSVRIRVTIVA